MSVRRDHDSLTITTPTTEGTHIIRSLKDNGFEWKPLPLKGYFHSSGNLQVVREALQHVQFFTEFQFPQLGPCATVWSDAPPGRRPRAEAHESILRSVLSEHADWPSALAHVKDDLGSSPLTEIIAFGNPRYLPQALSQSSSSKVAYVDKPLSEDETEDDSIYDGSDPKCPELDLHGDIAIICRFPKANSPEQLWDLLCSGTSTCSDIREQRFAKHLGQNRQHEQFWANLYKDVASFNNKHFNISAREAMYMDPQQRIILEVAYEALLSAGYLSKAKRESEVGCYLGVGAVEYGDNVVSHDPSAFSAPGTLRAFISGRISHHFNWSGPSICVDTACSLVRLLIS